MDGASLKEELRSCQHFIADSELARPRRKVFIYAMENLSAKVVGENIDHFPQQLKVCSESESNFGLILKCIQEGDPDINTHRKTIHCWIDPKLYAQKTTWQS